MLSSNSRNIRSPFIPSLVIILLLCSVLMYQQISISTLSTKVEALSQKIVLTEESLNTFNKKLAENVTDLHKQTEGLTHTLTATQKNIDSVKSQVGGVEQAVGSITGAVGNLQKLAVTDPELLKKYSKVYFMNENYVPAHLAVIPPQYLYSTLRTEQFTTEALPALRNLFDAAERDNIPLYVKSAYRSFKEQKSLKSSYTVMYGAGTANSFSADQGYSEHQLGTTIDFITKGLNGQLVGFDNTQAYIWLQNNAYRYGFILSYPKGNNYYVYEPWHWRYVGVKLATYLHDNRKNFYDLDQREIDTYLANLFD